MISTGIAFLDNICGGFKAGDNVVWQITNAAPVDYFIKEYFSTEHEFNRKVIYINFNYSPHTVCKKYPEIFQDGKGILVDAFTNGKGLKDAVFNEFYRDDIFPDVTKVLIDEPADTAAFISRLNEIEVDNRDGSFYLFDSLTGMKELWKDEKAVLDFFAFTCPKLYDLNTIAYWVLEKDAHSKEFLAGISHITQVVFNLDEAKNGDYRIRINKLDQRESSRDSGYNYFKIAGDAISFSPKKPEISSKIGDALRELRKNANMTQSDLADELHLTSGALSQIENGIIAPSLQTLIAISEFFHKPVQYFISGIDTANNSSGYEIIRSGIRQQSRHKHILINQLLDHQLDQCKVNLEVVKAGTVIDSPIILHKGKEYIYVVKGAIEIIIAGESFELTAGESILITSSFIEKISVTRPEECQLLHLLFN